MRLDLYQQETARIAAAQSALLDQENVPTWGALVGLRNRIVHDYMNIDMAQVRTWVLAGKDSFVSDFLLQPWPSARTDPT